MDYMSISSMTTSTTTMISITTITTAAAATAIAWLNRASMSHSCLTAQQLQEQYGQLLAEPRFQPCSTGYLLAQALMQMQPPIRVSAMAASVWLSKVGPPSVS